MIKNNKKLEKKLIKYLESIIKDIKSEKISIIPNSIDFSRYFTYCTPFLSYRKWLRHTEPIVKRKTETKNAAIFLQNGSVNIR